MWKTLEKPGLEISVPLWSLVFKKDEHRLELENNRESLLIDRRKKKLLNLEKYDEREDIIALCKYIRQVNSKSSYWRWRVMLSQEQMEINWSQMSWS